MTVKPVDAKLAVVIPTLNGGKRFELVLDQWLKQEDVGPIDICWPDSGSQDGTIDLLRQSGVRTLPIAPKQFNHGETRNRAVATTKAEFIILSVQDALPLSAHLARTLIEPLKKDSALSATYGRQVPLPDCHPLLVERIGSWAGDEAPRVQEIKKGQWEKLSPAERHKTIRYDHVIAAIRRSAWEAQRFESVPFGEDVAWAKRIICNGGKIAFVPGAAVEHSHNRSAWDEARRIYCDHAHLHQLIGLVTIPRRKNLRANIRHARTHYQELIEASKNTDAVTKKRWSEWADALARYENWAQFLGAHYSHRWWFSPVDRWLRHGI